MIDQMAQRYGLLPSKLIETASTFDMVIMDMAMTYEQHQVNKDKPGYVLPVKEEELLEIMNSVK